MLEEPFDLPDRPYVWDMIEFLHTNGYDIRFNEYFDSYDIACHPMVACQLRAAIACEENSCIPEEISEEQQQTFDNLSLKMIFDWNICNKDVFIGMLIRRLQNQARKPTVLTVG